LVVLADCPCTNDPERVISQFYCPVYPRASASVCTLSLSHAAPFRALIRFARRDRLGAEAVTRPSPRQGGGSGYAKIIEWDEALSAKQDLSPPKLEFGPAPTPPVPIPGQYRMT